MNRHPKLSLVLALALVPALAACGADDDVDEIDVQPTEETAPATTTTTELRVAEVDVGTAIGADRRVTTPDDSNEFGPNETIYVAVVTEGTGTSATLTARWLFEDGQVVDETTQTLSPTGQTVTEFHISKPDGLPVGEYEVKILLNGNEVESEDFTIR